MRALIVCAATLATCVLTLGQPDADLVVNGGFEPDAAGWQFTLNGAEATGQVDSAEKHSGQNSFKLTNKSGFAPDRFARLFQIVRGLRPYTTYRISCWAKGQGCGIDWIGGGPGWTDRHPFPKGDFDWQPFSFELNTSAEPDNYELMVLTESETAALWVDDIHFEPVKVDQAKQDALYAELNRQLAALRQRLKNLENGFAHEPNTRGSPYVQLGLAVANRFIGFAERGGPDGRTGLAWSRLQIEEVAQVVDETEKLAHSGNSALLDWRAPKPGSVRVREGTFYRGSRPFYFAGYGHFDSVIKDLPDFPALGASLIQDGRAGPSAMKPDGTLGPGALAVLDGLDRAQRFGMRTDFLLSPHYYPDWANAPDLHNGNIGFLTFNIFHPKAKATLEQWIAVMAERLKHKPALHSVCLANEPVYISSGRDVYTRPAFISWLKQKHRTAADLNALYGTSYNSFDEAPVPPPSMPAGVPAQRAYYDWTSFNKEMFADWHAWLGSQLKQHGIKEPTHTKIMVFLTLDRDKLSYGVDPELMCRATDLAGCDAYAFPTGPPYAYDWFGQEFFYDLLHSFRGQPVFNSENHLLPDNSPPAHIPMNHSRSVLWQGGLHHQGSTTIWVWEQAADPSLAGSIFFRPANVYGAGRAMLDLQRLAPEVFAINTAAPHVALLYSPASIFWQEKYQSTIYSLYTALNFLGQNVTFISERQLAEGAMLKLKYVLVPNATHILSTTRPALERFTKAGGKVVLVGTNCLSRDEYDRQLTPAANFPQIDLAASGQETAKNLQQQLTALQFTDLRDTANGQTAWAIEFRVVQHGAYLLVPLINFNPEAKVLRLSIPGRSRAVDLLSGQSVELDHIRVEPMLPLLLRCE